MKQQHKLELVQVMISQFVVRSPTLGSVLTAQSLEPAPDSVSLSLSLCPSPAHTLFLRERETERQTFKICLIKEMWIKLERQK